MGALPSQSNCQGSRAPGRTRTGVTALQVRSLSRWTTSACLSVGPVGIEPTSAGLRDRCIALSATIPFQLARRELNPRPSSYKDAALTAELRASDLCQRVTSDSLTYRAGGIRTHTGRIKSPSCCRYTTTLLLQSLAFEISSASHSTCGLHPSIPS